MYTFVLQGGTWNMEQVHGGICEMGLYYSVYKTIFINIGQ